MNRKKIEEEKATERLRKILNGNITNNLEITISYTNDKTKKNEREKQS